MSGARTDAASQRPYERGLTSIVIVAADSGSGLAVAVDSALASSARVEVIVSDNASTDGSLDAVAARAKNDARLRIVHNGKNIGFGAGCNRGTAHARGDVLFFLNPDCRLERDQVQTLRAILDSRSDIGLLGALIVAPDGAVEPASRRHDPVLRRALMSLSRQAHGIEITEAISGSVERVDAISGAAMMIARDVFDRVDGMDQGYFLHCEDLDLSRRVRDAGLCVACATGVRIEHGKGGSSRRRPLFVAWHKHRGMWRWFTKFDP
ncbi:MAG TPA: glycosyltransferase family 2 protein, partial [Rudaea sp.]